MGLRSAIVKAWAKRATEKVKVASQDPVATQMKVLKDLLEAARNTRFMQDHGVAVEDHTSFKSKVPIRDYEALKPYIDRVVAGDSDVLWPGKPTYLCKTSGTTSGTKYIPLTKESLPMHIRAARNALFAYISETGKTDFTNGKMIFLQGSPVLDNSGKVPTGRLSGIVADHVPAYLRKQRLPSYATNCMEDWEAKVDKIVEETIDQDMSLISGIPPWVLMYFEKLLDKSGKENISELFPNLGLLVHGGVDFRPYRSNFRSLLGKDIDMVETYPASEGFIAYQDQQDKDGLLLLVDNGMFFEFIPKEEVGNEKPTRLHIGEVELGVDYALVINSNAGLWGYLIGDLIRFTELAPPRIVVSGRVAHFISAFGEHVIGKEVDAAMAQACTELGAEVSEFTVAPQVQPKDGLPYHEWFVEFDNAPEDFFQFAQALDAALCEQNSYYKDLITGNVLRRLVLTPLPKGAFAKFMQSQGRLGGQNKLPRLANDRKIVEVLVGQGLP